MSIIEKALNKSTNKGEQREKSSRPTKDPREKPRVRTPARPDPRRSELAREHPPLADVVDDYSAPVDPERLAPKKNRPDFPRKTLKQIALNVRRLDAAGIIVPESK